MHSIIKNPNWWRRRTTLERCLTLISIFAVIAIIGLVIGLISVILSKQIVEELKSPATSAEALHGSSRRPQNEVPMVAQKPGAGTGIGKGVDNSDICLTSECIHTASAILKKMKPEVEPCDDFYQFACGTFIETKVIPEDKVSISVFSEASDELLQQLQDIVTEEHAATDPKHFRIPNTLYKACMNTTLIEALGAQPIRKIAESLGDWPVIIADDWDLENKWTWQETVKNFRRLGFSVDYIFDFSVTGDLKNKKKRIIELDQPFIGLSREYLIKGFNETLVSAYYDYMVDMAVLFGANRERALKELHDSLQFEMDLANISWPAEKRRDSNDLYNLFTIKQLQEKYTYMQWLDYIKALLPAGLKIDENELINLSVPSFFDDLGELLAKTPKRVVANYMMWRIHGFAVSFLPETFRRRQAEYHRTTLGLQEQEARWKQCVNIASGTNQRLADDYVLPLAASSLYVRKYFDDESKAIALEMVNSIRDVFSSILDEIDWMDAQTKQEAKKKLHNTFFYIGYPDELLDNNKLAEYYEQLEIDEDQYFQSLLNIKIFGTNYSFNKLRLPVDEHDWTEHCNPADINAYYSPNDNCIDLPAGILQEHFFNAQRPKYTNYGSIGYAIGHELTHGFDDQGSQFDAEGNLVNWWHPDTQKAYLEKARCIIEQYGNYTDKQTGLNLNGINTQGENIADNGGVKESYLAYKQWVANHGPEPKLPGLDYTPEQLFWISLAQTWCTKDRTEIVKSEITTNPHPPFKYRILGSLSNSKNFSEDFHCPAGSPMNPTHKCEVW